MYFVLMDSPFAGNAILSKDIVDRHREKTLALLWKIALAFQVLYIWCVLYFLSVFNIDL